MIEFLFGGTPKASVKWDDFDYISIEIEMTHEFQTNFAFSDSMRANMMGNLGIVLQPARESCGRKYTCSSRKETLVIADFNSVDFEETLPKLPILREEMKKFGTNQTRWNKLKEVPFGFATLVTLDPEGDLFSMQVKQYTDQNEFRMKRMELMGTKK